MSIKDELEDYIWQCGDCVNIEPCPACWADGYCTIQQMFIDLDDQSLCDSFEATWAAVRRAEGEIADAKAELADRMYDAFKDEQMGL